MKSILVVLIITSCASQNFSQTSVSAVPEKTEGTLTANKPFQDSTEFSLSNAKHFAQLSALAYQTPAFAKPHFKTFGYDFAELIEDDVSSTQMYLLANSQRVVLVYRGTETNADGKPNEKDLHTNFQSALVDFSPIGKSLGKVHKGFQKSANSLTKVGLKKLEENGWRQKNIYITGHSLGGALAEYATAAISAHGIHINATYLFGSPLIGDNTYAQNFNSKNKNSTFRLVYESDPVPSIMEQEKKNGRVYVHAGKILHLTSSGVSEISTIPLGSNWADHGILNYVNYNSVK